MINTDAPRRSRDVPALVARAREGDARAVARLISLVENGDPCLPELAAALAPHTGQAQIIGLTGSPGVGKSTITNELVRAYRAEHWRVGVLAVDPSSPFTGGAILGDRVRMQDHATDPRVYIRSMSSRGHLGGLAAATPQAVRVLDAAAARAGIELKFEEGLIGGASIDVHGVPITDAVIDRSSIERGVAFIASSSFLGIGVVGEHGHDGASHA